MIPSSADITLILAMAALLISVLNLWFSHLKGPDIDLCDIPKVELQDWKKEVLENYLTSDYVPHRLDLLPIQFVFVNNGSRTGAITRIDADFKPSREFKPFFKDVWFRVEEVGKEGIVKELPASIEPGGTCVIKITSDIRLVNWTDDIRLSDIQSISNIKEAVRRSLNFHRQQFKEFVDFLRSKQDLGTFDVKMTCLAKPLLKVKLKTKELISKKVENTTSLLFNGFSFKLQNWDNMLYLNKLLRGIQEIPDPIVQIITTNLERLEKPIEIGSFYGLDSFDDYWRRCDEPKRTIIEIILERYQRLKSELDDLNKDIRAWNSTVNLISAAREDVKPDQIENLNNRRVELKSKVFSALLKVREFKRELME